MPRDYFDPGTVRRLNELRARALADRREALIEAFPNCAEETLHARWRPAAERLMANWLRLVGAPAASPVFAAAK